MLMAPQVYLDFKRYTHALSVALGERDLHTRLHAERVTKICEVLGLACGLDAQTMQLLHLAAVFHDIGKIGIPDRVLLKPGPLDEEEWAVMRQHSEIGERILRATGLTGCEAVAAMVRSHHEHFDGGGYPDGLKGAEIPLPVRILSLADSYDAMAMTRTYHAPRAHAAIVAVLLTESGNKHDPALIELLLRTFPSAVP